MIIIVAIIKIFLRWYPNIKRNIRIAHIPQSPHTFVKKSLISSLFVSFTVAFLLFLLFDKLMGRNISNLLLALISFLVVFTVMFIFLINTPKVYIRKRRREIDKEVLFAGRYLLVKMQSGMPLFNALIEASKSYGVSSKYFKEIVDDIEMGTPIEQALDRAVEYSASENFQKILWQITNTIKTGVDTTKSLKTILEDITKSQALEIKRYGKKLNSLSMFYMLIGVVLPSIGMTLFIVISSFIELRLSTTHLTLVLLLLVFMQFMFLSMFKMIRPTVNI